MTSFASHSIAQGTLRALCASASLVLASYASVAIAHDHKEEHAHDHDHAEGQAQHAHVHGVVQLDVAADGSDLFLELTAPQADITGFERQAQTDAEKQTVAAAHKTLSAGLIFTPSANAACKLERTQIQGLGPDEKEKKEHRHDADTKSKEHDKPSHDHAADKAAHSHSHDHDHDHDHAEGEKAHAHQDVSVSYQFHCDALNQLNAIDVQLSKAFTSIHTINVQLALPQGQFSRTLKAGETRLTWN